MDSYSTCLVKITGVNFKESDLAPLLSELERVVTERNYEIVCLGNQDFTISDLDQCDGFAVFIQFNFPLQLTALGDIEREIASQLSGACSIDMAQAGLHYQLMRIEKCEISFK